MSVIFKVTILGCGSASPHKHHWPSCQVLQYDNQYFILDAGEGLQYHLHRHHIPTNKVAGIFITHLHGDHIFGLVGYLLMLELRGRTTPLDIYAPAGVEEFIMIQLNTFVKNRGFKFPINFHTVTESGELFSSKSLTVEAVELRHRNMPCFGYIFRENSFTKTKILIDKFNETGLDKKYISTIKILFEDDVNSAIELGGIKYKTADFCQRDIKDGKSYAYCTDNSFDELTDDYPLVKALKDVTVLYHEASYKQSEIDKAVQYYHSTASQTASLAKYANVKQLVIGHLSARYNDEEEVLKEAHAVFPNTILADEDKELIINN